ncbi:MAG: hypothetical protein PF444_08305 [Bacteroidales bacterium]|nr:hypothetical protein [Bacteroidales bacterium]
MNKDNAAQYLPLVQALTDGKDIQYRHNGEVEWETISETDFVGKPENYRVKPEPIVRWVNVYDAPERGDLVYFTKELAIKHRLNADARTVKLVEVPDETNE